MTIDDAIARLLRAKDKIGGDAPVRLAIQTDDPRKADVLETVCETPLGVEARLGIAKPTFYFVEDLAIDDAIEENFCVEVGELLKDDFYDRGTDSWGATL